MGACRKSLLTVQFELNLFLYIKDSREQQIKSLVRHFHKVAQFKNSRDLDKLNSLVINTSWWSVVCPINKVFRGFPFATSILYVEYFKAVIIPLYTFPGLFVSVEEKRKM